MMLKYRDQVNSTHRQVCIDILKNLVKFKTYSKEGEKKAVTYIASVLRGWGFDNVKTMDTADGRLNLVCKLKGSKEDDDSLLLNGHVDVVPPGSGWDKNPFSPKIEKGRMYGRGTSDMKGGIAAMMEAMATIKRSEASFRGSLIFTVTADEESTSVGAKELVKSRILNNVQAVMIAEPTNLNLVVAEKGAFWVKFLTKGKAAHGSRPGDGINAIQAMGDIISFVEKIDIQSSKHKLLGKSTMNLGTIKGGERTNMVPDWCEMTLDFRLTPELSPRVLLTEFREIAQSIENKYEGLEVSFQIINDRPAIETNQNEKFVKLLQDLLKKKGLNSSLKGVSYYSDASILVPKLGIPFAIFGPGNIHTSHQANEFIEIPKLLTATQFYVHAIARYFGIMG